MRLKHKIVRMSGNDQTVWGTKQNSTHCMHSSMLCSAPPEFSCLSAQPFLKLRHAATTKVGSNSCVEVRVCPLQCGRGCVAQVGAWRYLVRDFAAPNRPALASVSRWSIAAAAALLCFAAVLCSAAEFCALQLYKGEVYNSTLNFFYLC